MERPVNTHGHNLQDQVIPAIIAAIHDHSLRVLRDLQQDHLQAALIKEVRAVVQHEAVHLLPLHLQEAALPGPIQRLQEVVHQVAHHQDPTLVAEAAAVVAAEAAVVDQDADANIKKFSEIISK